MNISLNRSATTPLEQNFSTTPTPASIELHEMQTLIPQHHQNYPYHHYQQHQHHQLQPNQQSNLMTNDNNDISSFRIIPNGNGIFHRIISSSSSSTNNRITDNQHHQYHHDQQNDERQQMIAESCSSNIYSSTPLIERKTINGRKKDLSEILLEENAPQLFHYPILSHQTSISSSLSSSSTPPLSSSIIISQNLDNNHIKYDNDYYQQNDFINKLSSSSNLFVNNSNKMKKIETSNLNSNPIHLQNGSIKTLLPPNKHSNSSISISTESVDSSNIIINSDYKNVPKGSKVRKN